MFYIYIITYGMNQSTSKRAFCEIHRQYLRSVVDEKTGDLVFEDGLVGAPHTLYLSGKSIITPLKLV